MTEQEAQSLAREVALRHEDLDKKHLRFNDIVRTAFRFYNNPKEGVIELTTSCSKSSDLYVKGCPMWQALEQNYAWMINPKESKQGD